MHTKQLGNNGEQYVCSYLEKNSFVILQRNYTTRSGEVDIIATKGDLLIFVEVKTRKNQYFPTSMVVNRSKQRKIISAARSFILKNHITDKVFRFDVATLLINETNQKLQYIPNAFTEEHY